MMLGENRRRALMIRLPGVLMPTGVQSRSGSQRHGDQKGKKDREGGDAPYQPAG
jgi:hypothetical protein